MPYVPDSPASIAIFRFAAARDAILQADEILTGGENKCTIWHAFSSRGLVSRGWNIL